METIEITTPEKALSLLSDPNVAVKLSYEILRAAVALLDEELIAADATNDPETIFRVYKRVNPLADRLATCEAAPPLPGRERNYYRRFADAQNDAYRLFYSSSYEMAELLIHRRAASAETRAMISAASKKAGW